MNNVQSLYWIVPELMLTVAALIILAGSMFNRSRHFIASIAGVSVLAGGWILLKTCASGGSLFFGLLQDDLYSGFFRLVILLAALILIPVSLACAELKGEDSGEFFFFLLFLTATMMLAAMSSHLLMVYITIEAISIMSYVMAGYLKRDIFSSESGI